MSRRGNSQRHSGQVERYERTDPFREMRQMMRGFGGLDGDPFFGSMMEFGKDPFEDMFNFSNMHKNLHSKGTQGSYVMQSFVSTSKMGPDGKMITENYFENNMGEHKNGNTISQKQQAYKNSQGVNRIAEQRMLNDKGRKIVREKVGNNVEETNHYYNIDEDEAQAFDSNWRKVDGELKFLDNHRKYLQNADVPRQMQLGYEPQGHRPQHERPQGRPNPEQHRLRNYQVSRGSKRSELSHNSKPSSRKY